jgi:hypothetical protein
MDTIDGAINDLVRVHDSVSAFRLRLRQRLRSTAPRHAPGVKMDGCPC